MNNFPIKTNKYGRVKVCTVCGDQGFIDSLVTCNQCNELAEHYYCLQTFSEYVPEADWFCAECKLKKKVSTHKISLISSHPLVKQSQSESKKQAVESTNVETLLQRDSSLMELEGAKGAICAESQHIDVSTHSRGGLAFR